MESNKTSTDGVGDTIDDDSREQPREPDLEKNVQPEKDEAFLVKFEENENINPRNWSNTYKAIITLQLGFLAYVAY